MATLGIIPSAVAQQRILRAARPAGQNPLEALIQGFQEGQAIQNLPETLALQQQVQQDQALSRQLNIALQQQKLQELQNPDLALAREIEKAMVTRQINQPGAVITPLETGVGTEIVQTPGALTPTQQAALDAGGAQPTVQAGAPIQPILSRGVPTGFGTQMRPEAQKPIEVGNELVVFDQATGKYKSVFTGAPKAGAEKAGQFVGFTPDGKALVFDPGSRTLSTTETPEGVSGSVLPKTQAPVRTSILAKNEKTGKITNIVLGANEAIPDGFVKYEKPAVSTSDPLAFSQAVRKDPVVKQFGELRTQFDRMRNAIEESKTGGPLTAVDQTLINTFNKILDPDSVVRESEYARTSQDQSVMSYLRGKFDPKTGSLALGGAGLDTPTREAMVRMAERFFNASQQNYNTVIGEFSNIAQASGLDPELVLPKIQLQTPVSSPVATPGINPNAPSPVSSAPLKIGRFTVGTPY